jgi:large conductance mechanosensitive channel
MLGKKFFSEFKEFAERGSAIDMAVGIIAGSAMTSVVNSLVKDLIMPPIGILLGGVDFSQFFVVLKHGAHTAGQHYATVAAAQSAGATTLNIGLFINSIVSFILTMFAIFILVKTLNKMRDKKITTRTCPYCCMKTVSVEATKCPYCCSALKPEKVKVQKAELGLTSVIPVKKLRDKIKKIVK